MPQFKYLKVADLKLDLSNYRTVPQKKETNSIHSMVAVSSDRFWALTESLLDDRYLETETIVVEKSDKAGTELIVREGNRRIGALKIILGLISTKNLDIPEEIEKRIKELTEVEKAEFEKVPCSVFEASESATVDRLVALTHGYDEKAAREKWNPIARARHNRDKGGTSEPALDLLEKYLKNGTNLSSDQRERWAGAYQLSVLEEAMKKIAPRIGTTSSRDVADKYPDKVKFRAAIDKILLAIGLAQLDFKQLRNEDDDFGVKYGLPALVPAAQTSTSAGSGTSSAGASGGATNSGGGAAGIAGTGASGAAGAATGGGAGKAKINAVATNDPRSVSRKLRRLAIKGANREKVKTLQEEIEALKLDKHPHAFCFLLRSMFEISAKAYCIDNGLQAVKADGTDRMLVDILRDVAADLIKKNPAMKKELTGAMAELGSTDSFLSVTSLNQLIHNKSFSIHEQHVATLFNNIFPLLEAMNR